jgi:O-acetyl-ADP-ribose deacetylase (regulator of RNase III)
MIEYRTGDILTYEGKYICQGVNTLGIMGNPEKRTGGLALQIREKYPKVYEVYKKKKLILGDAFGVDCGKHIILNIAIQKEIGRYKKPLNYTALIVGLNKINEKIKDKVAFPLIGCGLAGGEWPRVEQIIEEVCTNIDPIVYYLNDEIPY